MEILIERSQREQHPGGCSHSQALVQRPWAGAGCRSPPGPASQGLTGDRVWLSCSRLPHSWPWKRQQASPWGLPGRPAALGRTAGSQQELERDLPLPPLTHLRADVCWRWRQETPMGSGATRQVLTLRGARISPEDGHTEPDSDTPLGLERGGGSCGGGSGSIGWACLPGCQ